jgi:hypothetical protein
MKDPERFLNPEKNKNGESDNEVAAIPPEENNSLPHPSDTFSQFLISSPLFGAELRCIRDSSSGREVQLEA